MPGGRRASHLVRPRLVWCGVGGACLGMAVLAWAVATGSWWGCGAGVAVLLAGTAVALAGGALHDTHSPDHLPEEARAVVQGAAVRVGRRTDLAAERARAARDAEDERALLAATARTSPRPFAPLAALVVVTEGFLLLAAQGPLYPMSHHGESGSYRVLGAGVVLTLAGMRVLLGAPARHWPTLVLVLLVGLALLAGGIFLDHDSAAAPFVESCAGALAVVAAVVAMASPKLPGGPRA